MRRLPGVERLIVSACSYAVLEALMRSTRRHSSDCPRRPIGGRRSSSDGLPSDGPDEPAAAAAAASALSQQHSCCRPPPPPPRSRRPLSLTREDDDDDGRGDPADPSSAPKGSHRSPSPSGDPSGGGGGNCEEAANDDASPAVINNSPAVINNSSAVMNNSNVMPATMSLTAAGDCGSHHGGPHNGFAHHCSTDCHVQPSRGRRRHPPSLSEEEEEEDVAVAAAGPRSAAVAGAERHRHHQGGLRELRLQSLDWLTGGQLSRLLLPPMPMRLPSQRAPRGFRGEESRGATGGGGRNSAEASSQECAAAASQECAAATNQDCAAAAAAAAAARRGGAPLGRRWGQQPWSLVLAKCPRVSPESLSRLMLLHPLMDVTVTEGCYVD